MHPKIKINGKSYPYRFGYGSFKELARKWQLNGPIEVCAKIAEMLPNDGDSLTFEGFDVFGELVLAGIRNYDNTVELDLNDVCDTLFQGTENLSEVFKRFAESMPKNKADDSGNSNRGRK